MHVSALLDSIIDKAELGRHFWNLFHATLSKVSEKPTFRERRRIREFLESMSELYPCEECREGFEWIKKNPPDFSSKKALVAWGCSFHNYISEKLGKAKINCEEYASTTTQKSSNTCPTCSANERLSKAVHSIIRMEDIERLEKEHRPFEDPQAQMVVRALLDYESNKYGVPPPRSVKFQKTDVCPNTACNVVTDPKRPAESTTIYYYRPEGFNMRSTLHEFYHYMSSVLGPEKVKEKLGPDFKGDPDDEEEADKFAFKEIEKLKLYTPPSKENIRMDTKDEVVVRKQEMVADNIFHATDALYEPIASFAKEDASILNLQYTPAILQRIFGVAYQYIATPLGAFILNGISWATLGAIATFTNVGSYGRQFLNEWAANHLAALIEIAGPGGMSAIAGHAKELGSATARGEGWSAFNQVIKPTSQISASFRAELDAIQKIFTPFSEQHTESATPVLVGSPATVYQEPAGYQGTSPRRVPSTFQ